jgi:predicted enzyme related to lactoylglutathione lyase
MTYIGTCFITDDVPMLTRFYETILKTTAEGNEIHAEIGMNGTALTIYSRAAAEREMGFRFDRYSGTGRTVLSFRVDNVDFEYTRLKDMGLELVAGPTTYPWGSRALHFRDPDGNMIGFTCPVRNA